MTSRIVIEVDQEHGVRSILSAIEAYQQRLQAGIDRGKRRLAEFEARYGVDTNQFLDKYAAEDLTGGDVDYVEWAGEAKIVAALELELEELEKIRYEFPGVS